MLNRSEVIRAGSFLRHAVDRPSLCGYWILQSPWLQDRCFESEGRGIESRCRQIFFLTGFMKHEKKCSNTSMAQILLNKNTLHECEMNYSIYIFEDTLKKGLTKDLGE